MDNQYYVYVIFRLNGQPCYVGKGKRRRAYSHLTKTHNVYLGRIIASVEQPLPIVIVREHLSEEEAFEVESSLIRAIGRLDKKTGPLVNLTDGGDGVSGYIQRELSG